MDNKQPLVSIVMPSHNGQTHIKRALMSVLQQTYKNLQALVVDDGSTDKTCKIVSEIIKQDPRVILLKNNNNIGFVKTLNKGMESSQGKYIARLDDDDFWLSMDKLAKQVEFLEKHLDYTLVGGGIITTDKSGNEIMKYLFPETDEKIRKTILVDNAFAHSTVVFRREAFLKAKGYDEQFGFFADRDLWLKLGLLGKFYNFQEFFACYLDKEQGAYSARNKEIRRRVFSNIKLRIKYKKNYPGFVKAFLLCWVSYFYSLLPFREKLRPILFYLRVHILGRPSYKYSRPVKE